MRANRINFYLHKCQKTQKKIFGFICLAKYKMHVYVCGVWWNMFRMLFYNINVENATIFVSLPRNFMFGNKKFN